MGTQEHIESFFPLVKKNIITTIHFLKQIHFFLLCSQSKNVRKSLGIILTIVLNIQKKGETSTRNLIDMSVRNIICQYLIDISNSLT